MERNSEIVFVEYNCQESEAEAMRNMMTNTQLFADAVVVQAAGFAGSFARAKESVVLATCFGDEETLSATILIRGQL
jgi:hypothetical protein